MNIFFGFFFCIFIYRLSGLLSKVFKFLNTPTEISWNLSKSTSISTSITCFNLNIWIILYFLLFYCNYYYLNFWRTFPRFYFKFLSGQTHELPICDTRLSWQIKRLNGRVLKLATIMVAASFRTHTHTPSPLPLHFTIICWNMHMFFGS